MTSPSGARTDNDLPLMSNTSEVLVRHYILDLSCNLEEKTFLGILTLFLDISLAGENKQVFSIQEFQDKAYKGGEPRPEPLEANETCSAGHEAPGDPQTESLSGSGELSSTVKDSPSSSDEDPDAETRNRTSSSFKLILDSCDIAVSKVKKISHKDGNNIRELLSKLFPKKLDESASSFQDIASGESTEMRHHSDRWALYIEDPDSPSRDTFPPVIKIHYRTKPEGCSLRWVADQDGNPCVYTAGMWVNNRSFLPCQEYGSLSTWQAFIKVAPPARVVMCGDQAERSRRTGDGAVEYYFRSSMPLPSFAMAIAVGSWDCVDLPAAICDVDIDSSKGESAENPNEQHEQDNILGHHTGSLGANLKNNQTDSILSGILHSNTTDISGVPKRLSHPHLVPTCQHSCPCHIPHSTQPVIPCRIISPKSLLPRATEEFAKPFGKYCNAVQKVLGPCPFPRMDIVIYPPSCQDMAMCNPNLLFVSRTMLAGDQSMCIRLGHELSHYWFGLLIGARDWTEEWLSEGFATFVEDLVHADVMGWTMEHAQYYFELAAYLRYKTLAAEMEHTSEELQTLRPNEGKGLESSQSDGESAMFIKNGMNPNKLFSQVHYLKGYFLIRWLSLQIGVTDFLPIFRKYVEQHHGQMVRSRDFLNLVFDTHPQLKEEGFTVDQMCRTWLDCPGMPEALRGFQPSDANPLYMAVIGEVDKWEKLDRHNKRMRSSSKRPKRIPNGSFCTLSTQQLLLLLDKLLEKKSYCGTTLGQLNRTYNFSERNAEIQHRWMEMVVKHQYTACYRDLGQFLVNHQAMGVYLFGEMVISRSAKLCSVAKQCFESVQQDMENTTRNMVHRMLYGS